MGLFRKARAVFHDDWCSRCQSEMEIVRKQLYAMPMLVGGYLSHKEPDYYKANLTPVERKAEIPTGRYACGIIVYCCPACGHRAVKLSIFLPVRGVEKYEDALYFEHGEMDDFLMGRTKSASASISAAQNRRDDSVVEGRRRL